VQSYVLTAMLDIKGSEQRVSTGLAELDQALEGLYWGDNVVWQLDSAPVTPFYSAIAELAEAFDARAFVSLGDEIPALRQAGVRVINAGPGTRFAHPAELLREIHRLCRPGERRLLLFDSLDRMVATWGTSSTRGFFARCCPMLLDLGAIAYWSMSTHGAPATVRDTVEAVTQCVLRVDDRSVRVAKAEARSHGVRGSVLHWREEAGRAILSPANINGRVAASLRALRRARGLSQNDLATLAGVTPSAISQAERAERGLSLGTLAQLSLALGITIDDLLHGEGPDAYRIGRRPDDMHHTDGHISALLGGADSDLLVELVHLGPRQAARPVKPPSGAAIVAVASGLVQVQVAGQTPAVRSGEVLVSRAELIEGWRNIGQTEAMLFWIIEPASPRFRAAENGGGR
jgi:transcriptional regulator with XRE-family HTH domain